MATVQDLFTQRKSLDQICRVPDKIISVYSLEKHVWADGSSELSRETREPELQTIEEFQIDPVRPFLNDVFRNIAAPYNPERRDSPIGQGYWIQAEFGSGKSHLLCFLSALALGDKRAWELVRTKEEKAGRGRRESLYRFWEEGVEAKSTGANKRGIFVIVKTLVGAGGGTVGLSESGRRLTDYIIDAAKEQLQIELGKNISLYPAELLADRFISQDLERYRRDLGRFLKDPRYFDEDEFEDADSFIADIQQNKSPEFKRACGNKLWRFYTDYLQVQPHIAAESEEILRHMVQAILAEGYTGVLLVLDEVSLFMKNRNDDQRADDEQTLVVLSNRLAKVHNLPIWTVCAAQQAIESKMGVKNIIADDRLKFVELLKDERDYYNIVLARVREIVDPGAINSYYLYYKRGFTWPNSIGETDFTHFFPFHRPALEVLRAITYELTTTRSAIAFMHQTLKHQIKAKGNELIRLWELFDETVRYEEDPSGTNSGLVAVKTKKEIEYNAYTSAKSQIEAITKGVLKVYRDKAIKTLQTLFLYHVAHTRQQGLSPEEIANSVMIERQPDSDPDENIQHYEQLSESLMRELPQITQTFDEDKRPRYRFEPVMTMLDPKKEFQKARDEAEDNEKLRWEAWNSLLAMKEWPVKTRKLTLDLSGGVKSLFHTIAPVAGAGEQTVDVNWQGRIVNGRVRMLDFRRFADENLPLPALDADGTDLDFAVYVSSRPVSQAVVNKLLAGRKDPRIILWTPAELTGEEADRLSDYAAYRKLIAEWGGKDTDEAVGVVNWVSTVLQTDMAKVANIIATSYARGRVDAINNMEMEFHVAGELGAIIAPLVGRVLTSTYELRDIVFEPPFVFRREEGVKVINGIVKIGSIPKGAKPNQDISAAQNFGFGLKIMKKTAERQIDTSDNPYVEAIWNFIDSRLTDRGQAMPVETLYKNFMGIGGLKPYGLTRRMVQIFLLCLVRTGKVRVGLSGKSGLPYSALDYSNIAQVEFSSKVLDGLTEVQKMEKPENWEVLRPYAEKLIGKPIASTHDDAVITQYRTELRELFAREGETVSRVAEKAKGLSELLGFDARYVRVLEQIVKLFDTDLAGGDDINLLLYALKEAFGYEAFDSAHVSDAEVDDLANRLQGLPRPRALRRVRDRA